MRADLHDVDLSFLNGVGLTELHTHAGSSLSARMLWDLAHDQGIRLETKDYWEFENMVTLHDKTPFEDYLKMHDLTEKIQSSPEAMFTGVQHVVEHAYLTNNITTYELRYNPIFRNRKGERDLDHLIVYSLQGMERALLKYPMRAGLILMMDRRLSLQENEAIVKKAIKYRHRGIVGIDLAGSSTSNEYARSFKAEYLVPCVTMAREAGLGITIHTGETTGTDDMWQVIEFLKPERIGHGVRCVYDKKLMGVLREQRIVLEICPSSVLHTGVIKDIAELKSTIETLKDNHVLFTINTDGPEMQQITLKSEYALLLKHEIMTQDELLAANELARNASFISKRGD